MIRHIGRSLRDLLLLVRINLNLAGMRIRRAFGFFVFWCKGLPIVLGGLLLLFGIYQFFWVIPNQQIIAVKISPEKAELTEKEFYELRNSIRQTFLQALGGAAVLLTLYFTAKTWRTTQEGQITERFNKAIEHLGDKERLTIRLGGIYALERIARDSPKDHWQIIEVLTAYVRDNAPWPPKTAQPLRDDQTPERRQTGENDASSSSFPKLATDIEAVLAVLGRRIRSSTRERNRWNLTRTDLRGAFLHGAHLEGADLREAHLEQAVLVDAHLEQAVLDSAHLEGAELLLTHLEQAALVEAHLEQAVLVGADLKEARLHGAHLKGADLHDARLKGAVLDSAHLEQAVLVDADLKGADLHGAHLEGADLRRARLEGADLRRAHLEGAVLRAAHLERADLRAAHLEGADLHGAHLEGARLKAEQLATVQTLEEVSLDQALREQLQTLRDNGRI